MLTLAFKKKHLFKKDLVVAAFDRKTPVFPLTGKHLFLVLSIAKFIRAPFLKNICVRLLLKMCSRN